MKNKNNASPLFKFFGAKKMERKKQQNVTNDCGLKIRNARENPRFMDRVRRLWLQ